jgi:tetratricopeptide (TPR) repeat protein
LNDVWEEELEEETRQVRIAILNNLAAVSLKQENYTAVINQCQEVLGLDSQHSKALYRLTQAQFALGLYDEAFDSVNRGLKVQ